MLMVLSIYSPSPTSRPWTIERMQHAGLKPYLIVGIYDDTTISKCKGTSFPLMNMTERALLLLQSQDSLNVLSFVISSPSLTSLQYVSAVVLSAPLRPALKLFSLLQPFGITLVYFGAVAFGESPCKDDRYAELKEIGVFLEVRDHPDKDITTDAVRERLFENREAFEPTQRAKRSNEKLNT